MSWRTVCFHQSSEHVGLNCVFSSSNLHSSEPTYVRNKKRTVLYMLFSIIWLIIMKLKCLLSTNAKNAKTSIHGHYVPSSLCIVHAKIENPTLGYVFSPHLIKNAFLINLHFHYLTIFQTGANILSWLITDPKPNFFSSLVPISLTQGVTIIILL